MEANVIVCSGCCCGNLSKGYDEVPVDFLKDEWKSKSPAKVSLTISGCIGVCSMRNVVVIETKSGLVWLGGLSGIEHYSAIVDWACKYSDDNTETILPEKLRPLVFNRIQSVSVREPRLHYPNQFSEGVVN